MRAAAFACLAASSAAAAADNAILFFDGSRMSSWSGLQLSLGEAHLLSEYRDPSSFVGWGYPSTWKKADGSGWRTMYQGWHLKGGKEDTKLALLADSPDAVHWSPAKVILRMFPEVPAENAEKMCNLSPLFCEGRLSNIRSNRLKSL